MAAQHLSLAAAPQSQRSTLTTRLSTPPVSHVNMLQGCENSTEHASTSAHSGHRAMEPAAALLANAAWRSACLQVVCPPHPRKGSRLLRSCTFSLVSRMNSCRAASRGCWLGGRDGSGGRRCEVGESPIGLTLIPSGFIVYCLTSTSPVCSAPAAAANPLAANTRALRAAARSMSICVETRFKRV